MRILTICGSWRVFGAETITLKMLEGFKRRGHEQIAVTSVWTDGDFSRRLKQIGIREETVPLSVLVASLSPRYWKWAAQVIINLPILWWRWHRVLRIFKPDVIVSSAGGKTAMFLLPWLGGRPCYLIEFGNSMPTRAMRCLYRLLGKRVTGFVAVSDYMRGPMQLLGIPPEKIFVIKSGAFFEVERRQFAGRPGAAAARQTHPPRVGIAGQIAPSKGHDCLLAAVGRLKRDGIVVAVEVFGSGDPEYTGSLKEKIERAGLADLWHWRGYESDKRKIFESFDMCVVPSCFGDPFPTVAMEAGVYGLPVIASRIGGLPEIVQDGVTGFLIEPNSAAQLAEKIRFLVENPAGAREMGMAGRERVFKEFTVEKMVAEFESLFRVQSGII